MSFTGIPLAALDFYEDLAADNSKTFWSAHEQVYKQSVKEPMLALISELEPKFGSAKLFRPYRDVRFSKDKTPYKTAQGAVVHTGTGTGYYAQINAAGLYVGGGFYQAGPAQLARFRGTVADDVRGPELEAILAQVIKAGFTIGGDQLKTKPKGFAADHPRIDLLRHKSLTAGIDFGCPPWLSTARAASEVTRAWEDLRPLIDWLTAVVGTEDAPGH